MRSRTVVLFSQMTACSFSSDLARLTAQANA